MDKQETQYREESFSVLVSSFLAFSSQVPKSLGFYTLDPLRLTFFGIALFGIVLMFLQKFSKDLGFAENKISYISQIWFKNWNWVIISVLVTTLGIYGISYIGIPFSLVPAGILIAMGLLYVRYV